MPLSSSLLFCPQELQHVDQGIQIPAVLHFLGDDVFAGDAGDGAAQIGQQEVMQGSLPAAHAGAYGLLLDVLAESSSLLSELGMEGSGEVTHGVEGMLITLEEHFFGARLWRRGLVSTYLSCCLIQAKPS